MTLLPWIAWRLRYLADWIDRSGAPKRMSHSFTFEPFKGIVFRDDNRGCPLWYYGDRDYERAHAESETFDAWRRIDYRSPEQRR